MELEPLELEPDMRTCCHIYCLLDISFNSTVITPRDGCRRNRFLGDHNLRHLCHTVGASVVTLLGRESGLSEMFEKKSKLGYVMVKKQAEIHGNHHFFGKNTQAEFGSNSVRAFFQNTW